MGLGRWATRAVALHDVLAYSMLYGVLDRPSWPTRGVALSIYPSTYHTVRSTASTILAYQGHSVVFDPSKDCICTEYWDRPSWHTRGVVLSIYPSTYRTVCGTQASSVACKGGGRREIITEKKKKGGVLYPYCTSTNRRFRRAHPPCRGDAELCLCPSL